MVCTRVCLTIVKGEAETIWLWSEYKSCVDLFLGNWFFHVPSMDLVGSRVDGGDSSIGIRCNSCLLVGIIAISEFKNLADEDSLGIRRVRTCIKILKCEFLASQI